MDFVYNWTTEDFTYPWSRDSYTLKAGTVYSDVLKSDDGKTTILMGKSQPGIAMHFAKHLANREMIRTVNASADLKKRPGWNMAKWKEMYERALTPPPSLPEQTIDQVSVPASEETPPVEKKKGGRPRKMKLPDPADVSVTPV